MYKTIGTIVSVVIAMIAAGILLGYAINKLPDLKPTRVELPSDDRGVVISNTYCDDPTPTCAYYDGAFHWYRYCELPQGSTISTDPNVDCNPNELCDPVSCTLLDGEMINNVQTHPDDCWLPNCAGDPLVCTPNVDEVTPGTDCTYPGYDPSTNRPPICISGGVCCHEPMDDATYCASVNAECGVVNDQCGYERTCPTCSDGLPCNNNVCACVDDRPDQQVCDDFNGGAGVVCGSVPDDCGVDRPCTDTCAADEQCDDPTNTCVCRDESGCTGGGSPSCYNDWMNNRWEYRHCEMQVDGCYDYEVDFCTEGWLMGGCSAATGCATTCPEYYQNACDTVDDQCGHTRTVSPYNGCNLDWGEDECGSETQCSDGIDNDCDGDTDGDDCECAGLC